MRAPQQTKGFTLIELSIVLVIIGLIVGGVLVGQNLIAAAEVRATISQVEKYNTAVNTFRGKYGELPGDMDFNTAAQFGFSSTGRVSTLGRSDGNGVIEGCNGPFAEECEPLTFWEDLTVGNLSTPLNINLIDGTFNFAQTNTVYGGYPIANFFPPAKLGRGNYFYVYSTGGVNYYGLSATGTLNANFTSTPALTVSQAYQMDKKVDDGFPATGNVTATYNNNSNSLAENAPAPTANASASDSSGSCYNSSTTAGAYSLSQNNGAGVNCALSFRFQ